MTFAETQATEKPQFKVSRRTSCTDETLNNLDPYLFELLDMLAIRRMHDTETEKLFCKEYMKGITKSDGKFVKFNILKHPETGEVLAYYYKATNDPVLWSSHVDTVHSGPGFVNVAFDSVMCSAYVSDASTPLGADDAAGMWLLFQMIRQNVGGTYIFHKAEEVGGVGSKAIAKFHQGFLQKFKYAIAFDRKATHSIITHQGGMRCCSDEFADSFANLINKQPGMAFEKDDGGVFTDTKSYINLIGECTNISCGYTHEHTSSETLDVEFLISLKNALIASFSAGFTQLKEKRKPGEQEPRKPAKIMQYPKGGSVNSPVWGNSFVSGNKSAEPFREGREQYFNKYSKYTSRKQKVDVSGKTLLDIIQDKEEIQKAYFDIHDMTAFELDAYDSCIVDSDPYIEYDEMITQKLIKFSRMGRNELRSALINCDISDLVSVVKRLISDAGY